MHAPKCFLIRTTCHVRKVVRRFLTRPRAHFSWKIRPLQRPHIKSTLEFVVFFPLFEFRACRLWPVDGVASNVKKKNVGMLASLSQVKAATSLSCIVKQARRLFRRKMQLFFQLRVLQIRILRGRQQF